MTIADLKAQNLILFEAVSGSRSFGLETPTSDTDIKGVFYLPKDKFFGLGYIAQISNESNDIVYYELGRFIELLQKNNPNILEMLASPEDCILYRHPIMEQLKMKDFLSKLAKETFAGYAVTQIKKARGLKKKILNPMLEEKKSLLDFCTILQGYESITLKDWLSQNKMAQENCGLISLPHAKGMYAVFYDAKNELEYKGIAQKEASNEVSLSSIPKGEKEKAYLFCNQEAYSSYCKDYREYWEWMEKRNEDRFATNLQHGENYDSKNMMHTIRLLQSTEGIMKTGTLKIRVTNREELLDIKAGNRKYDAVLQMADDLLLSITAHYQNSTLPEFPDTEKTEAILVAMRESLYFSEK